MSSYQVIVNIYKIIDPSNQSYPFNFPTTKNNLPATKQKTLKLITFKRTKHYTSILIYTENIYKRLPISIKYIINIDINSKETNKNEPI